MGIRLLGESQLRFVKMNVLINKETNMSDYTVDVNNDLEDFALSSSDSSDNQSGAEAGCLSCS